ncbi:MAG: ABC transporter permease [Proteobacteria bacterium]|nr:ABC transporter permease [Pseudomonadota bacterium]
MLKFILKRLLATIPVITFVAVFIFLLLRLTPGDPAAILAGDMATPQEIENIRQHLGLNDPIHIQFVTWIGQLAKGDLGISIISRVPVLTLITQRFGPTLALSITTLIFAILVAIPLGVIAAWKHGTWIDRCVMIFSILGFSMPVFVLGYIWIYSFSMQLAWFPVQGYQPLSEGFIPFIRSLALPTLTLGIVLIALFTRITRATVREVLSEDYIRTAYAKGAKEFKILLGHALPNAGIPIITVIGIGFALLLSGVVVTESVFNIPGLGRLTVNAILERDYPTIQGVIMVFSLVYVFINLLVDISYTFFDPRIKY